MSHIDRLLSMKIMCGSCQAWSEISRSDIKEISIMNSDLNDEMVIIKTKCPLCGDPMCVKEMTFDYYKEKK